MKKTYVTPAILQVSFDTEEILAFSTNPIIPDNSNKSGEDAKDFGSISLF